MKQDIDNKTMDMWGEDNSHSGKTSPTQTAQTTQATYEFYVRDHNGNVTRWTGLTKTKAQQMHAYTSQSNPCNVVAFGWELRV